MAKVMESVSTINSLIRTLLAVVLFGAVGAGGWWAFQTYQGDEVALQRTQEELEEAQFALEERAQEIARLDREVEAKEQLIADRDAEISQLNVVVEEQEEQIERLDTALRLVKVRHRIARLTVIEQDIDPDTGELYSVVEFAELNEDGQPIGEPRPFRIKGDLVYIDNWVVKFEDEYVEQADIDRSTSLVLFRRIFGEEQKPIEGYPLDVEGSRPEVYGEGAEMSDFERRIWDDFWQIANNEELAREMGIYAAHGEAPSIRVEEGKSYRIELRASDGLTITPESQVPPADRDGSS